MLTELLLQNFKCFSNAAIPLTGLTVLSGRNGVGKSSIIQSILLMQTASEMSEGRSHLSLNDVHGLELGCVGDVISQQSKINEIVFEAVSDTSASASIRVDASSSRMEERYLTIKGDVTEFKNIFPATGKMSFVYLSADRIGPKEIYPRQSKPTACETFGPRAEYFVDLLHRKSLSKVRSELRSNQDGDVVDTVQGQLQAWIRRWMPGIQIRTEIYGNSNACSIWYSRGIETEWMKPTNVGYGITHSIPVVLAGLIIEPRGLLIVDSPESHLHPAAQSAIGWFLSVVAASGVQVLVETHSDHVLNGIRRAVKSKVLESKDATALFLCADKASSAIEKSRFEEDGKIDHWPAGFFDQTEKDLIELI